jgi:chromosome segregation ATPase
MSNFIKISQTLSGKVGELRKLLQELSYEKELIEFKAGKVPDLEEEVQDLRRQNKRLEEDLHDLFKKPFIGEGFKHADLKKQFEDAMRERDDLRTKVEHLKESTKANFAALTATKRDVEKAREEREAALQEIERLKEKYHDVQMGHNILQDKLRLYTGDDGIDLQSLERALTLVKRKAVASEKLPFLEDPEGESLVSLPMVRRKLDEVQDMNLKLTEEVVRLEHLLKLQTGINKDLHQEMDALRLKKETDNQESTKRAIDAE